jgi:drug/metabolite transporter (DMT)-like permease
MIRARNDIPLFGPTAQAAFWMTGAIVSFSAMAVAGRAVSHALDTFEIMLFRSVVGLIVVIIVARALGTTDTITGRHMGLHTIRNIGHFAGQNLWFFAITVVPLMQVFALEFTSPLWVVLLAPLVLGERITWDRVAVVGLGLVGVVLVARPWEAPPSWGLITAAIAAIGFAISALFTRKLTRTESVTCILFWMTLMQAVFGVICAGWDGDIALPAADTAPWLVLIALAGLLAHLCITQALSRAPASVVMPFDFIRLPVITIIGIWLYAEAFDPWALAGGLIIFGAGYVNVLTASRAERRLRKA